MVASVAVAVVALIAVVAIAVVESFQPVTFEVLIVPFSVFCHLPKESAGCCTPRFSRVKVRDAFDTPTLHLG